MAGRCIIIAAGELTVDTIKVEKEDFVIAADGGLVYCDYLKIVPDIILGDFDSLSRDKLKEVEQIEDKRPEKIVKLPKEKDDTDTLAGVRYGLSKGYKDFRIYAGCGGARLDHTIANIQTLLFIKNHDAVGYMLDGNSTIFVIKNETVSFKKSMQGRVSLFSMGDEAGITIKGMKYELDQRKITNDFPVGASNEFIGQEATVTVENGAVLCMVGY